MFDAEQSPEQPLDGTLDIEALAQTIPAHYTVKGMFFSRFIAILGPDYASVEPRLSAAPRGARYLAFKDYLQADYSRIVAAAAAKRYPRVALREAVRCVARDDLATFADSMLGKVLLSLAGDARSTLHRTPEAYARVAPGAALRTVDLNARTSRVIFEGYRGMFEYTLGQLEGVVLSFGRKPTITLRKVADDSIAFNVVHGA